MADELFNNAAGGHHPSEVLLVILARVYSCVPFWPESHVGGERESGVFHISHRHSGLEGLAFAPRGWKAVKLRGSQPHTPLRWAMPVTVWYR